MAKAVIAHLGECSRDHPQCARCSESLLPSRIIDLGPPGKTTEPRLKINNKSEIGHYACLSYCWGGAQEYMTTQANIDGYLKSLSLSSLSKAIQDAIKVTRMLHLRYLWIDALCIIQDSPEDKRREMAYMGMIYKNATVTIAAARAKFVSQGFLDDWSVGDAQPAVLPLIHRTKGSVRNIKIVNTGFFNTNLWPLESRAWALQEYLLSPRLLIFGYGGPVWQCQTQKLQPIIPSNQIFNMDLQRLPDTIFPPPTRRPNTSSASQNPAWPASERQEQHLTWKSIVENYSARQISFASDRLQAIAGIASELSYVWNDRYHFGMWHANLYQQLVWFAARPQQAQKAVPGMPSWSWLRINAGIKHLDYLRSVQLPSIIPPLSAKSRFFSRSSCYVVGRNLVVNDADFLPANEMAKEEKRNIFDIVEDRNLWLREKALAEYLIELEGTRSYSRVGPLAAIVDFDKDVESEVAGDTSTFQRDFEYGACEPGVPKVGIPHWHDQVAYLTLGGLLGGHYDLGSYHPSLYQNPEIADTFREKVHIGLILMPVKGSFTTYERIGLFVLPGYGNGGESVFTKYSVTRTITIK